MNRANCGKTAPVAGRRRRGLGWTLAALLWIGGAGGAQALFFNGDFAPSQWEADPVGSNIQWIGGDGVNTATAMEITGPATPGTSLTDLSLALCIRHRRGMFPLTGRSVITRVARR